MTTRAATIAALLGAAMLVIGAGAASGQKLETRSATTSIGPDSQASVTASCQPHAKAWSGGFALASLDPNALFPIASFGKEGNPPIYSARSWISAGINFGDDTASLTSYAYCRHELDDNGLLGRHGTQTELDPLAEVNLSQRCPSTAGKVIYGGFIAENDEDTNVVVRASYRLDKFRWVVSAKAFGSDPGTLVTQYGCRFGTKLRERTKTETASGNVPETAVAECKRGQRVISGGFETETFPSKGGPFVSASRKQGPRKWRVRIRAAGPEEFTSYAYCERKGAR